MGLGSLLQRGSKHMSRVGLHEFLLRECSKIPQGATVMNVGSGGVVGEVLKEVAQRRGLKVVSTDIDPDRHPDIVDDISQSKQPDAAYGAIVISEVLEHVTEPWKAIIELERLLQPGGILILTTPFMLPIHDRPYDFYRYTRYGLAHLLRNFDNVIIAERNGWAETILTLVGRVGLERNRRARVVGAVLTPVALILLPLAKLLSKFAPTDFLTSGYCVIASKGTPSPIAAGT